LIAAALNQYLNESRRQKIDNARRYQSIKATVDGIDAKFCRESCLLDNRGPANVKIFIFK
jgi:hypothetical protein